MERHINTLCGVHIKDEVLACIPESVAREMLVIAIDLAGDDLLVACSDNAFGSEREERLRFILNRAIIFARFPDDQILDAIERHYQVNGGHDEEVERKRIKELLRTDSHYALRDNVCWVESITDTSVALRIGRYGKRPNIDGRNAEWAQGDVLLGVGWLDIHYPCHGFHKLFIRCGLPKCTTGWETMHDVVGAVKTWLQLPKRTSYRIDLIGQDEHYSMEDPFEGIPCYTNRESFEVPEGPMAEWDLDLCKMNKLQNHPMHPSGGSPDS